MHVCTCECMHLGLRVAPPLATHIPRRAQDATITLSPSPNPKPTLQGPVIPSLEAVLPPGSNEQREVRVIGVPISLQPLTTFAQVH